MGVVSHFALGQYGFEVSSPDPTSKGEKGLHFAYMSSRYFSSIRCSECMNWSLLIISWCYCNILIYVWLFWLSNAMDDLYRLWWDVVKTWMYSSHDLCSLASTLQTALYHSDHVLPICGMLVPLCSQWFKVSLVFISPDTKANHIIRLSGIRFERA